VTIQEAAMTLLDPQSLRKSPLCTSTLARLTDICGRLSEERPALAKRIAKAYDLVAAGRVTPCAAVPGDVLIPASKGSEVYRVGSGRCECPDFLFRGATCAHRLARRLYWVAQAEEARAAATAHRSGRSGPLTAEDHVRSGAQLAGVLENEARIHLREAKPPKTPRPSKQMAKRCQEIAAEQAELRRTAPCGTSTYETDPEARWSEWEEMISDLE
jgi:hypothetical protein